MKTLGIVLALLPLALASKALLWDGLRVKWVPTATRDRDAFYDIPRTAYDAECEGWVQIKGISNLNVTAYCLPDDARFCILLDNNGSIAGCQIGLLVSDVADLQSIYNMSEVNMFSRKIIFGQDWWTSTFFTVDPNIIQAGGREEMYGLTGTDGVWIVTTDGYLKIPRHSSHLNPIWKEETCIDWMGTHFYFNTSANQICSTIRPLFVTYDHGQLISIGWFTFGKTSIKNRPWIEGIPVQIIGLINPAGPLCLYEGVKKYGLLSMHIYFRNDPWNISC